MEKSTGHRKQILLFLIAVFLPSLVLVVITVRMISQEKELAQKRLSEERRRVALEIGQHLLFKLENIKLHEMNASTDFQDMPADMNYVNPEVVLVCLVEERQLVFPWEKNQDIERAQRLLSDSEFMKKIQKAQKEEFENKNYPQALRLYKKELRTAKNTLQKEYARFLMARVLLKLGQKTKAIANYKEILKQPFTVSDEYGIPLSLYAAGRLLEYGENYENVWSPIQKEISKEPWLSPAGSYLLQDLVENFLKSAEDVEIRRAARECNGVIQKHIQRLEQAMALQNDFMTLGIRKSRENPKQKEFSFWVCYGNNPWLISLAESQPKKPSFLIVISVQKVLDTLKSNSDFRETFPMDFNIVSQNDSEGLSLGSNFQGIGITFGEGQEQMFSAPLSIQPGFYLLALLLILGITLFGAYLLWRDVRREVKTAEMRSQFVSSVSHELKTPLTAIRMFAETLRLRRTKNQKTQTEYLDTIVNESQRLTRLLNNVLDFSKIEQGKRFYRFEQASLYEIVESAVRTMEYPLNQQGFKLDIHMEDGLPQVPVDRDALEQALLNLLHNAMKYSGDSRKIGLYLKKKSDHALIQVVDQGIGIAPREKRKIFEKFYRVPSPQNERIVGTGLGLALVSHIVEAHQGQLELESEPGIGSTFSLYIPLKREP